MLWPQRPFPTRDHGLPVTGIGACVAISGDRAGPKAEIDSMSALETGSHQSPSPSVTTPSSSQNHASRSGPKSSRAKALLILLLAGGAAAAVYAYAVGPARARREFDQAASYASRFKAYLPRMTQPGPVAMTASIKPPTTWDGLVKVPADEARTIGLLVVSVQPQTVPIKLELPGRTDYDPNTLSKIRPRFDTLVEKVHAELGQKVRKGDPLVDLFSTELASAKNDFQTAFVQWQHDLTLRNLRENLYKEKAVSEQLLVDTRNDENKSRLNVKVAREKLRVFGVPDSEIDPLIKNLNPADLPQKDSKINTVLDKARMTRVAPSDGIVITRDVVPGNFYDSNDVLMVIAPLDHLFVWVNVYESDQAKVDMGQRMEITFPYLDETIPGTVQYVSPEVSKETRAIKIRATVPNSSGRIKSDMLVRAALEVPPVKGWTVIPRLAMVVMNGNEYSFVRKSSPDSKEPEQFERRKIILAQERDDHVVVKEGLKAGEQVASNGSLILSQLFEEQQMVATGMPLK
jgi:membrane fusion protein, heavy metal efflux system